jgi:two-component system, OmpR family, sensor histidine kinase QseC
MPFVKNRWLNSFRRQLLVASIGGILFGTGLVVVGLFAMRFFQEDMFAEIGIAEYAESMGEQLQFDATGQPVAVGAANMAWLYNGLGKEATYRVLNDHGEVMLSSEPGAPPLMDAGEILRVPYHDFVQADGLIMHATTEEVRHGGRSWYVQFAVSDRLSNVLRAYVGAPLFSRSVALFGVAALILYWAVMQFLLRIILKPLNQASALAAKISPRNLGERLPTHGVPKELKPLVENFNAALDRLEHNYRLQQDFLASAAHELKTPLSLIRGQIELGDMEAHRTTLLNDVEHMSRQVQQLLHLAEASEPQNYVLNEVNMVSAIHEVVQHLARLFEQHGVAPAVQVVPAQLMWRADRGALFTLLKNLIENAIQHSPPGTLVQINADSLGLAVSDMGTGVAASDLPKLFERFWRGAHRRDSGAGLGLSICREIAVAHGWQLMATRGNPGMTFTIKK